MWWAVGGGVESGRCDWVARWRMGSFVSYVGAAFYPTGVGVRRDGDQARGLG